MWVLMIGSKTSIAVLEDTMVVPTKLVYLVMGSSDSDQDGLRDEQLWSEYVTQAFSSALDLDLNLKDPSTGSSARDHGKGSSGVAFNTARQLHNPWRFDMKVEFTWSSAYLSTPQPLNSPSRTITIASLGRGFECTADSNQTDYLWDIPDQQSADCSSEPIKSFYRVLVSVKNDPGKKRMVPRRINRWLDRAFRAQ
ncbi:hypothetical protein V865_005688 [Kwoniella europaea PYCC6329]|uniref:Uncharacterized protein n=1 Tax=Kwoniella europaea PYCC6329 TaxID=1423913 RepID=A0AAX4KMJ0_9TREE